jgi:hypothetical protein
MSPETLKMFQASLRDLNSLGRSIKDRAKACSDVGLDKMAEDLTSWVGDRQRIEAAIGIATGDAVLEASTPGSSDTMGAALGMAPYRGTGGQLDDGGQNRK